MIKIEDYLEKHPEASLKEYYDYCNSEKNKENEQLDKIYNWHKSIDGKYFKLIVYNLPPINDKTIMFFKYTCPSRDFFKRNGKALEINNVLYNYKNEINIFDKKVIHRYELCCPIDNTTNNSKLIEISEEDFNRFFKLFKTNIEQIKKLI